jgi:hypothetical protein
LLIFIKTLRLASIATSSHLLSFKVIDANYLSFFYPITI